MGEVKATHRSRPRWSAAVQVWLPRLVWFGFFPKGFKSPRQIPLPEEHHELLPALEKPAAALTSSTSAARCTCKAPALDARPGRAAPETRLNPPGRACGPGATARVTPKLLSPATDVSFPGHSVVLPQTHRSLPFPSADGRYLAQTVARPATVAIPLGKPLRKPQHS